MIFDTDVLIWYLRGNEKATEAVVNAVPFSISVVTYMELLQGMRNKRELNRMKKSFNEMDVRIIPIDPEISMHAAELVELFTLSSSMEMADALIASTCVKYGETLYTANDKHYRPVESLDISVFRPQ